MNEIHIVSFSNGSVSDCLWPPYPPPKLLKLSLTDSQVAETLMEMKQMWMEEPVWQKLWSFNQDIFVDKLMGKWDFHSEKSNKSYQ